MVPFEKYDALVQEIVRMKREGFTSTAELPAPAEPPSLPTVILKAIRDLGVDPQTERQLVKHAWELKATEEDDAVIAAKITAGEDVEL